MLKYNIDICNLIIKFNSLYFEMPNDSLIDKKS